MNRTHILFFFCGAHCIISDCNGFMFVFGLKVLACIAQRMNEHTSIRIYIYITDKAATMETQPARYFVCDTFSSLNRLMSE